MSKLLSQEVSHISAVGGGNSAELTQNVLLLRDSRHIEVRNAAVTMWLEYVYVWRRLCHHDVAWLLPGWGVGQRYVTMRSVVCVCGEGYVIIMWPGCCSWLGCGA